MFRCRDCGSEYEIKPDYCDCGNDTFDEIIEAKPEYDKDLEADTVSKPKRKKTFSEQYPMLSRFVESLDPISVVIFLICIALSVGSFFVIKPKPVDNSQKEQVVAKNEPRNVPDVNTFWDDTPPKKTAAAPQPKSNEDKGLIVQVIDSIPKKIENKTPAPVQTQPKKEQPKTTAVKTPVKTAPKTNTKTTTKPAVKTQTQTGTKKTTSTQQTTKPKTQPKPQQTTQPPKSNTQPTQPVSQPSVTQTAPQKPKTTTVVAAKPANTQNSQELKAYKDGLKRTLFAKMNMLNVYGDGSCVVDFKIDSTGKLINRSFSKQSSNNTLNDEVYRAIMSTPIYKAPPSSYNGQTLHFSVKMTNGQFSITLN